MPSDSLTVALISDVFHTRDGWDRLLARLAEAKTEGAELAVLPELPLNPWPAASKDPRDEDAEPPDGQRHLILARAAATIEIGVIGGAIVRNPATGARRNTALVFDANGNAVARYCKIHLPEEPGFWETSHYVPGLQPAQVIQAFRMPIGLQICSDINRPEGSHLLAALGAEAIVNPRATESSTFERWKLVFRSVALTTASYVLSVNRPAPEHDVPLGGPSIVVGPDGDVKLETTEPVAVVTLDRAAVRAARQAYPGYLPFSARIYATGWEQVAQKQERA